MSHDRSKSMSKTNMYVLSQAEWVKLNQAEICVSHWSWLKQSYSQVLWLDGIERKYIEEVGQ